MLHVVDTVYLYILCVPENDTLKILEIKLCSLCIAFGSVPVRAKHTQARMAQ
ncbi:uncharacterized protein PHALS_10911 [Plasmopara halstedii]|uniref:Uncharacterized protein n=1 Tax=Plasmopara halstedii TaxID=4781 RepID=A0A0P1AIY5_PLAHL|nr:uncharacterized protein PHALS_10911 [Plasmopara halstedii]CEG40727.1 hypothetical protein PHALS_10911 [Plasmopara halstedii]|eukprot:XP_024577096.1 hypothetical protein PHALS_10911 [Plasmopara halstedii]